MSLEQAGVSRLHGGPLDGFIGLPVFRSARDGVPEIATIVFNPHGTEVIRGRYTMTGVWMQVGARRGLYREGCDFEWIAARISALLPPEKKGGEGVS